MVSFTNALIALLVINICYMSVIAAALLVGIPHMIDAAVSKTRRNIYRVCRCGKGGGFENET